MITGQNLRGMPDTCQIERGALGGADEGSRMLVIGEAEGLRSRPRIAVRAVQPVAGAGPDQVRVEVRRVADFDEAAGRRYCRAPLASFDEVAEPPGHAADGDALVTCLRGTPLMRIAAHCGQPIANRIRYPETDHAAAQCKGMSNDGSGFICIPYARLTSRARSLLYAVVDRHIGLVFNVRAPHLCVVAKDVLACEVVESSQLLYMQPVIAVVHSP